MDDPMTEGFAKRQALVRVTNCSTKASAWTAQRNQAIRAARLEGYPLRAIAEAAQLSVEAVRRIANKRT